MNLNELGKLPIPGARPAGEDVRDDAGYDLLLREIEKLTSFTSTGTIDWGKVRDLSADILAGKSKDLRVACYLSAALLKTDGTRGLAAGVQVIRDMLDNFWDDMYPVKSRMRARRNAVEWWMETLDKYLEGLSPETWPASERDALLAALGGIDSLLAERMEDAPLMVSLIRKVESLVAAEEIEAPPELPVAAVEEKPASASALPAPQRQAPPIAAPAPGADLEQILESGAQALGTASALLAGQYPGGPLVFKLNRLAAWLPVLEPPTAESGRTGLPPPGGEEMEALKRLHQSGSWADLLEYSEGRLKMHLFWLDLNRFSWEALNQLGREDSGNVVLLETKMYVSRLPGIQELAFSDGTPFADEETKSWLASGPDAGGASPVSARLGLQADIARARDFFNGDSLKSSLGKIGRELGRMPSGRARLVLEIGLCRMLTELNQPRLALSFAEDIIALVERHGLEKWEPELALEGLATAASMLRTRNEDDERVNALLNRIMVLDPAKAMDLL